MLAAVKEKGRSRVENRLDTVIILRSTQPNIRSAVLNGRSTLLDVRSTVANGKIIGLLSLFYPIGGRSVSLYVENPFGIHRQRKAGVSLRN